MCVCVCVCDCVCVLSRGHFFKLSKACLNSEFSISWISWLYKPKEPSLPDYLPIAGEEEMGSRILV